jgi:hypothetical protein
MNPHGSSKAVSPSLAGYDAPNTDITIPELVGKIYDASPTTERCLMLDYLIKPLGVLALVGVSNGIFTKIWFRNGWHNFHIRPEDAQAVQVIDVISLVDYVQQCSVETINGLASLLTTSPMFVYSAGVAILVTALVQRTQTHRQTGPRDIGVPPDSASIPVNLKHALSGARCTH